MQVLFTGERTLPIGLYLLLLLSVAACTSTDAGAQEARVPFETIVQGSYAGRTGAGEIVVEDEDDLVRVWRQSSSAEEEDRLPPQVDFRSEVVVALFMGRRNTGGYSIEVEEVIADGRRVTVIYRERSPGAGEMVTQALTSPYHLVRFQRTGMDIRFRRR